MDSDVSDVSYSALLNEKKRYSNRWYQRPLPGRLLGLHAEV